MTRRSFVFALAALTTCLGTLGFPIPAGAQQSASPRRIGFLLVGFSREGSEVQQFPAACGTRDTPRDAMW